MTSATLLLSVQSVRLAGHLARPNPRRPWRIAAPFSGSRPVLQPARALASSARSAEAGALERLRSVLPGGKWWRLEDEESVLAERGGGGGSVVEVLRRMWVLVADERAVVFLGFVALVGAAVSELSIPNLLAATIFSAQSRGGTFYRNARLLVMFCLISGICSGLRSCCFGVANMTLVKRMRESLFATLFSQDVAFIDETTVGDLTSRLGSDCQQVSRVIGNDLNLISRNILQGAGAAVYLLMISLPLGLCTLFICASLSTIMLFHGRFQKKAAKLAQEYTASANNVAQEALSLFKIVRIYGTEKQEINRYANCLMKLYDVSFRQTMAYGYWSLSLNYLYHAAQVLAVLVGSLYIASGSLTAESLTKFLLYAEWLILSTWWIGDNWSSLMQSVGASEKVFQLMNLLPSKQLISEGIKLKELQGRIQFVNVTFSYPSRSSVTVLERFNSLIHPNEVVALVGLSGSGKSTIVNLLLRLYEPTDGQILVDNVPLEDLDTRWFREQIGYVGQEPRLFRMDVSSNIRYGCTREVSQEEVEWAARQAFAHEFILSLPNGYNTLVDDALLSGGQKQRIAIARAILRDPTILILDEATSALDAQTEHYVKGVMRSIQNGAKTRTVIVIAHRLSTIREADRIIVMDGGRIIEEGSHSQLINAGGLYSELAKRQADDME